MVLWWDKYSICFYIMSEKDCDDEDKEVFEEKDVFVVVWNLRDFEVKLFYVLG